LDESFFGNAEKVHFAMQNFQSDLTTLVNRRQRQNNDTHVREQQNTGTHLSDGLTTLVNPGQRQNNGTPVRNQTHSYDNDKTMTRTCEYKKTMASMFVRWFDDTHQSQTTTKQCHAGARTTKQWHAYEK
jgi:hypothetical protein